MPCPRLEQQLRQMVRDGTVSAQAGREAAELLDRVEEHSGDAPVGRELVALLGRLKMGSLSFADAKAWEDVALAGVEEGAVERPGERDALKGLRERQIDASRGPAPEEVPRAGTPGAGIHATAGYETAALDDRPFDDDERPLVPMAAPVMGAVVVTSDELPPSRPRLTTTRTPSSLFVGQTEDELGLPASAVPFKRFRGRSKLIAWNMVISGAVFFLFALGMGISVLVAFPNNARYAGFVPILMGTGALIGLVTQASSVRQSLSYRFPKDGSRTVKVVAKYLFSTKIHRGPISTSVSRAAFDGKNNVTCLIAGSTVLLHHGSADDCQQEEQNWRAYFGQREEEDDNDEGSRP